MELYDEAQAVFLPLERIRDEYDLDREGTALLRKALTSFQVIAGRLMNDMAGVPRGWEDDPYFEEWLKRLDMAFRMFVPANSITGPLEDEDYDVTWWFAVDDDNQYALSVRLSPEGVGYDLYGPAKNRTDIDFLAPSTSGLRKDPVGVVLDVAESARHEIRAAERKRKTRTSSWLS